MLLSQSFLGSLLLLAHILEFSIAAPANHEGLEKQKRTVARAGEAAVMGKGTYPRATFLKDASMLGCFTAFSNGNAILTVVKSTNYGQSWTTVGSIAQEPTASKDLDNCFVHQLPSGRVLAAFRHHDRSQNTYSFYRIDVCYSDDNGANWKYLSTAATSGTPGAGVWEPFMMDAVDGSLMLYYSREINGQGQDSILIRSTNGGANWSKEQTISGEGLTARDGMLGVTRPGPDRRNLIAVFESLAPDTGVHSVTSSDDGATWGNRRVVYKSTVAGGLQGAPQVTNVGGGKLVASFQTNEDDVPGGAAGGVPTTKVVVSTDGGATWGQKTTILAKCLWSAVIALDNSDALVMCESGGSSLAQKVSIT
ncbi:Sialidase [Halenospora varia]|nr:Sialidase [Halenospora varia]